MTTIRVEMVKTGAICKSHSREPSLEAPPNASKDSSLPQTPGEQSVERKDDESGALGEGGPSIGACDYLQMAPVLTTST